MQAGFSGFTHLAFLAETPDAFAAWVKFSWFIHNELAHGIIPASE
jgi:hypothetical protein